MMTQKHQKATSNVQQQKREDQLETKLNTYSALSFVLLMIILGVPVWYKTTEVYRADFPQEAIQEMNETTKIILNFKINLVYIEQSDANYVESIKKALEDKLSTLEIHQRLSLNFRFHLSHLSESNKKLLQALTDLGEFDSKFNDSLLTGHLNLLFINENFSPVSSKLLDFQVFAGSRNTFYCKFGSSSTTTTKNDSFCSQSHLTKILLNFFVSHRNILEICREHFDKRLFSKQKLDRNMKKIRRRSATKLLSYNNKDDDDDENFIDGAAAEKNFIRPGLFSQYSIELSIILPEDIDQSERESLTQLVQTLHSDFDRLTSYSSPLRNLTRLHFKSQTLHYVDFDHRPTYDQKRQRFVYSPEILPHLISSLEPYILSDNVAAEVDDNNNNLVFDADGSPIQQNNTSFQERKTLHFVLYFTPPNKSPLFILKRGQKNKNENDLAVAEGNGFLITDWGGVIIANKEDREKLHYKGIRSVLFSQLRSLLGFQSDKLPSWLTKSSVAFPLWDVRRLIYEMILYNDFGCISTLNSLNKLLAEITNIVIKDHIAESIKNALEAAKRSIHLLNNNNNDDGDDQGGILQEKLVGDEILSKSRLESEIARDQSEMAFYDESLLSLLYFPDDQKYAIYVPLFLPVLLPVFLSLLFIVKRWKNTADK